MVVARRRLRSVLAMFLLLSGLVVAAPDVARADPGDGYESGLARLAAGEVGVVSTGSGPPPMAALAPPPCEDPGIPPEQCQPATCFVGAYQTTNRGGTYTFMTFGGSVNCYGGSVTVTEARARLVDRTEGAGGATVGEGDTDSGPGDAESSGYAYLFDDNYPAASQTESVFSYTADAHNGIPWGDCLGPGFIRCDGVGTSRLYVEYASGVTTTGVRPPPCGNEGDPPITDDPVREGPTEITFEFTPCTPDVAALGAAHTAGPFRGAAAPAPKISCTSRIFAPTMNSSETGVQVAAETKCTRVVGSMQMYVAGWKGSSANDLTTDLPTTVVPVTPGTGLQFGVKLIRCLPLTPVRWFQGSSRHRVVAPLGYKPYAVAHRLQSDVRIFTC